MAVMQLAEQNKLDIDQPLVNYLSEFKINSRFGFTDDISLKNIMTHHSGLPADYMDGFVGVSLPPFTSVVKNIHDFYVANPANKLFAYSNLGFSLAGHAVQNVSQQPFVDYMNDALLSPLNMVNSNFTGKLETKGYHDNKLVDEPPLRDIPAGGLNTNVVDLSHLLQMVHADGQFQGIQILKKKGLSSMMKPQNKNVTLDLAHL